MTAELRRWRATLETTKVARWWRARSGASRFIVRGVLLMGAFYFFLYYPYDERSFPARMQFGYLAWLARVAGRFLAVFDSSVSVQGAFILGGQPLQIVLDCAAIDALALFAAAVFAFPARLRIKLTGLLIGGAIIWSFNVLRIVLLYVAGVKWPALFDILHEDVLAMLLVLLSAAIFAVWAVLSRRESLRPPTHVPSAV